MMKLGFLLQTFADSTMTTGKYPTVAAMVTAEKYACFNTMLELSCDDLTVLVFDTARYGRNDTRVSFCKLCK
jgi:hypothetical protein